MSEAKSLSARGVMRIPDFRRLFVGQTISDFGDAMTSLALLLVVYKLTGSTAALALMAICLALPQVTVGVIAGVYVDRWDRRRVMLASDLLRAALVLGFVFVQSVDTLWLLYVLALAQAAIGTFFTPARTALIPSIVKNDGLLAANSLVAGRPPDRRRARHGRGRRHRRPVRRHLAGLRNRLAHIPRLVPVRPAHQRHG